MKNTRMFLMAIMVATLPLGFAVSSLAMEHGEHAGHDHGKMGHDMHRDHTGMTMHGDMLMLGTEVQEGVQAMAHLKDVRQAMAKAGLKETHHFMVMFTNEQSGEGISSGTSALKIETPSGKKNQTVKLMGMQGHFGADVVLNEKGLYHFKVGTKLADGKKRVFHYHYEVK